MEVLPVFFRLFACQDKNLRQLLFRHIIAGVFTPPPFPSQILLRTNGAGISHSSRNIIYHEVGHSDCIATKLLNRMQFCKRHTYRDLTLYPHCCCAFLCSPWLELLATIISIEGKFFGADIKNSNRKHRNNKLNRAIQNFLYGALQVR